MENGSRQNARKVSSQLLKEEKEQSRRRAYRMVFASSIIYAALLVSAVISYFAYPEFFTDSELRTQFFRENYQGIVAVIAILSGIVTAAIVTPRTVLSALEMFIPGRVFAAGLSELLSEEKSIPKGSVGKAELGADLPTKISDDPDHLIGNLLKEDKILTPDDLVRHFLLRMQIEQIRLKNNALSNLIWGVLFSIVGLAVLSYPLISPQTVATTDWENFIIG